MTKSVLTGVDGHLGRVAAQWMLDNRQSHQEIVFGSYKPESIDAATQQLWNSNGINLERVDYGDVEGMRKVFAGAEAVGFISTWAFGSRPQQAANIVEAAKAAGVKRVCYTSFIGAGLGEVVKSEYEVPFLPRDHASIEKIVRNSGLQWNFQRDYLYADNLPTLFAPSWKFCGNKWFNITHGQPGAYVSRDDCGRLFGALMLGKGKPNTVYHVTGPEAVTDQEVFDFICDHTGYRGEFVDVPDEWLIRWWDSKGLPWDAATGDFSKLPMKLCMNDLTCCGEMLAKQFMIHPTNDVEELTGRKPEHWKDVVLRYEQFLPRP